MSHKTDISVISQKAPNKKQRKEEIKRSKSHLPTKVIFNLTTKYAVVLVVQSLCRGFSVHGILQARIWSGLPFPSLGDLPNPGMEARSPTLQADSLLSEHSLDSQLIKKKITRETRKYLETNEAKIYQKLGDTVKTVLSGQEGWIYSCESLP